MNNQKKLIIVEDLLHVYKGKVETIALPGINFDVKEKEKFLITGKSGVGKTTLLHCLAGILKPTAGKIIVNNENIVDFDQDQLAVYRRNVVGLIYQSYNLAPFLNIKENLAFPMIIADKLKEEREKRIKELVEELEISRYLKSSPDQLSGGEQQRVAIAIALVNNPKIVLADEPTGNIDVDTSKIVYELLSKTCEKMGTTLVLASHDPDAKKYVDREISLPKLASIDL